MAATLTAASRGGAAAFRRSDSTTSEGSDADETQLDTIELGLVGASTSEPNLDRNGINIMELPEPNTDNTNNNNNGSSETAQGDQGEVLREWSYHHPARPSSITAAPRTPSGTPIAVQVTEAKAANPPRTQSPLLALLQLAAPSHLPALAPSAPSDTCSGRHVSTGTCNHSTSSASSTSNAPSDGPFDAAAYEPPVHPLARHLDRTIVEPYGPVVSKMLTNSMCHLRCSLDNIVQGVAHPSENDGTASNNNEIKPGSEPNPAEDSDDNNNNSDSDKQAAQEEEDNWILVDDDYLSLHPSTNNNGKGKYHPSEYDDQDDRYEEELIRRHGRDCLTRRVSSLKQRNAGGGIGDTNTDNNGGCNSNGGGGGGPLRRVRRWVRRRREGFLSCDHHHCPFTGAAQTNHNNGGHRQDNPSCHGANPAHDDDDDDDVKTVVTDVPSLFASDSYEGPEGEEDEFGNEEHQRRLYESSSSDNGCAAFGLGRKKKRAGRKQRNNSHNNSKGRGGGGGGGRGWRNRSRNNTEDSACYQSSSSNAEEEPDGTTTCIGKSKNGNKDNKGRGKRKKRIGRRKNRRKGSGSGSSRDRSKNSNKDRTDNNRQDRPQLEEPSAPRANFIFRGAPPPPSPSEATLEAPPQVARFVGYRRDNLVGAGPTSAAAPSGPLSLNRSRTYSSPAAFGEVVVAIEPSTEQQRKVEGLLLRDDPAPSTIPAPTPRLVAEKELEEETPQRKLQPPPVDELMRSIDELLEMDDDLSEDEEEKKEEELVAATVHSVEPSSSVLPGAIAATPTGTAKENVEDDWILVPSECPVDPSLAELSESASHSIKVAFLSSPELAAEKSALVDVLAGFSRPVPRSSTGITIRSLRVNQDLKMSLWDVPTGSGQAALSLSSNTVYIYCYDLGASNPNTFIRRCSDAYDAEKAVRAANRALEQDIDDNVRSLANFDSIGARGSVVLPLILSGGALLPREEEDRRLSIVNDYLEDNIRTVGLARSLVVDDIADLGPLKKEIVINSTRFASSSESLSDNRMQIRKSILDAKATGAKIIAVDTILECVPSASREEAQDSLEALSHSGDLLYYGPGERSIIGEYAILDVKFLFSVVASILRPSYKEDISALTSSSALTETLMSCPIVSTVDISLLWQSMAFVKDAFSSSSTRPSRQGFYEYLKQVLVCRGILSPLEINGSLHYLIPSHLKDMPEEAFTYKTPEVWRTLLCHSWLFDNKVSRNSFNFASGSLLQYILSSKYTIHQIMLFKFAMFLRISHSISSSPIDVLCHVVDDCSPNLSVASATTSTSTSSSRVVVSARGLAGDAGQHIYDGGYRTITSSLDAVFARISRASKREIVCPDCLAAYHPSNAATWEQDSITALSESHDFIRCLNGHEVETALLCGRKIFPRQPSRRQSKMHDENRSLHRSSSSVSSLLGGVVLVGLYDEVENKIAQVGSGFVADKARGLVVTASHVFFDMHATGNDFGRSYFGKSKGKAIIGVLPSADSPAVFRYFAEILVEDVSKVDACVLRITTRFDRDVAVIEDCAMQVEHPVSSLASPFKELQELKLTKQCELEESIRILGYNQGGEGVLPEGGHVNRYPDFAKGYVCKRFKNEVADSTETKKNSQQFTPLEEIVAICPTIVGHSGGPVVNGLGSVIGILSRADRADSQRCYLVPSTELKRLLKKAKKQSRLSPMELYNRMNSKSTLSR